MELGNRSTHSRESTTEPRRKRSRPKDRQQAPTANGNAGTAEPVAGGAVTESQVQRLRQRLLEERSKAMRAIWVKRIDMEEHRSRGELDELDWDIRMVERQGEFIVRVEDALRRLRESPETFNVSEVSGRRIPFERLDFVPWTRRLTEEIDPDEFGV